MGSMPDNPLVSIIINNYNYGRYLAAAIESALAQHYQPLEVIVVDDGSTDHSATVIARYQDRVHSIFQANSGQGAALNAGFAAARGEILFFLDADDCLRPTIVAQVVNDFVADPSCAKVQFRLQTMDEHATPRPTTVPAQHQSLPHGDLRPYLLQFPDDLRWQPTSGNAFPRWVLAQILPMPTAPYRICADYYLSNLTPLFGPVLAIDTVGGDYRVHGANHHNRSSLDLAQSRAIINRSIETHRDLKRVADQLGLPFPADPTAVESVTFLAQRLTSRKLAPHLHPLPGDTVKGLVLRGMRAAGRRVDVSMVHRLLYIGWFLVMGLAPNGIALLVADAFLGGSVRLRLMGWRRPNGAPLFPLRQGRARF